jgi:hypothetical protein
MKRSANSERGNSANVRLAYAACAALLICTFALGACASGPRYLFNMDREADFASYRSFGFFDERAYQSVAHRHLKSAITREMQARGYHRSQQPDLLINIHLLRSEDVQDGGSGSNYYSYRGDRYGWRAGVETVSGNYTDGTLNIDVVDGDSGALLWEGIAVGSISQRMYENLEATIDTVAAKLFEGFPKQSSS